MITETKRRQIIETNVQKALASLPEEQRPLAKEQIYQTVEKQVDEDIAKEEKVVKTYGKQVADYALETISSSFADLYQSSIPFVLFCCLTGFVFWERKKKAGVTLVNTPAAE